MGVTDYLQGDHERLDAMIPDVRRLAAAGSFQQAAERFAELVRGLGRHIEVEEQILFPAFEQMTGRNGGPTSVMRAEHVELRRLLEAVTAALASGDAAAADESIPALVGVLDAHNTKEERVLYPMIDRAAGNDRARSDLVDLLRAF